MLTTSKVEAEGWKWIQIKILLMNRRARRETLITEQQESVLSDHISHSPRVANKFELQENRSN